MWKNRREIPGCEVRVINRLSCFYLFTYKIRAYFLSTPVDECGSVRYLGFGGMRFFYPQVINTVGNLWRKLILRFFFSMAAALGWLFGHLRISV